MSTMNHKEAWVALSLALGPRSKRFAPLYAAFGSPEAILAATPAEIRKVLPDIGDGALAALSYERHVGEVRRILSYCQRAGVAILTPDEDAYPKSLLSIAEPPVVLYCRGTLPAFDERPTIGMVGTRSFDAYGERVAYKISFELAAAGAIIVSGMADGIDGICHAAALDADGLTVAVLGCGIDRVYPHHHTRLFAEIAEFGAVLTEYAPGTAPYHRNFPARNRLVSALSEAVVVVQGDERSGALITARHALLQGKSLFAVPGNIDSPLADGPNLLLRAGARVVLCAEDVLTHFRFLYKENIGAFVPDEAMQYSAVSAEKLRAHGVRAADEPLKKERSRVKEKPYTQSDKREETPKSALLDEAIASLDTRQREIYALLPDAPFTADHLVAAGIPAGEAVATMTLFEILGIVSARPGGTYQKTLA
ncbi:MAG: DNA-processing protein DprA [Clostridia bacterium]|nr:DNA-processing protein DprA [Clostridia bacterium]